MPLYAMPSFAKTERLPGHHLCAGLHITSNNEPMAASVSSLEAYMLKRLGHEVSRTSMRNWVIASDGVFQNR